MEEHWRVANSEAKRSVNHLINFYPNSMPLKTQRRLLTQTTIETIVLNDVRVLSLLTELSEQKRLVTTIF